MLKPRKQKFIDFTISRGNTRCFWNRNICKTFKSRCRTKDSMTPLEDIYTLEEDIEYVTEHKGI